MKLLIGLLLGLSFMVTCDAAEVVAWKLPLSRYLGEGLQTEGIVRCKEPPEASLFFKKGDVLWDLKDAKPYLSDKQMLSLDWLIWDATSERLVAKGSWTNICALHENLRVDELPRHLKLTVGIYEVAAEGAPPAENAKPVSQLSMHVRSGLLSTVKWSGNGSSLEVEAEVWLGDTHSFADVRLAVTAGVPDQSRLRVNTAFVLKYGSPLWVARDFNGKQGLDLRVSGRVEALDGTLFREVVMIQEGNATRSLWSQQQSHEYQSVPVAGGGWITSCRMGPERFEEFINGSRESNEKDPFVESTGRERAKFSEMNSVSAPAVIGSILGHEVLDATEELRKAVLNMGLNLEFNDSFAGYDPIGQRLYFFSPNQQAVDIVGQCLVPGCELRPVLVGVALDGEGQTRLIGKAGQKAVLERVEGKKTVRRSFEIEPTIGEVDDAMNLRFVFESKSDAENLTEISSSNILTLGKSLEILSAKGADGQVRSLRLTGEVLEIIPR